MEHAPILTAILIAGVMYLIVRNACYIKVPPGKAFIISGMSSKDSASFKILSSGGTVILPIVQQREIIDLNSIKARASTPSAAFSKDGAKVKLSVEFEYRFKDDEVSLATSSECFLGLNAEEVAAIASDLIIKAMISTIESCTVSELLGDRSTVAERIKDLVLSDLMKDGLAIVSVSVRDVTQEAVSQQ